MTTGRAVVSDLRRINRASLLRLLFLDGPLNRIQLGRLTGLSSGSVTNLCAAMLAEELILETGQEKSDGGRPRVTLAVNPDFGAFIGVEVGEGGIRVESFDFRLASLGSRQLDSQPQHHPAAQMVDELASAISALQAQLTSADRRLLGVGLAVPGIVEQRTGGARVHSRIIHWEGLELERLLRERLGVPVFTENGAKALGQVEMWLGAGRGASDAVVALWGSGVGAAIFADGQLYRGSTSCAGEWGHACIVVGGQRCRCGSRGCLEAYVGAEGLLGAWQAVDRDAPRTDPDLEDWVDLLLGAATSPGPAQRTLAQAATYLGVASANLVNLFNPQLIVLGGSLGRRLGPTLLPQIEATMREHAIDQVARNVTLTLGRFGEDAVALGGATLVVREILASGGTLPTTTPSSRWI